MKCDIFGTKNVAQKKDVTSAKIMIFAKRKYIKKFMFFYFFRKKIVNLMEILCEN